jgi:hypothetical protein
MGILLIITKLFQIPSVIIFCQLLEILLLVKMRILFLTKNNSDHIY